METVIQETWLTRKPHPWAFIIGAASTLVMVIFGMIYIRDLGGWASMMSANAISVFDGHEFWRLWTTLFAHGDEKHLLSNSLLFFVLGSFMAGYFGLRSFPITALFFGGIINFFSLKTMPPEVYLIGMSGVVYWLGGAWLILYFLIDRRKSLYQRAVRAIGVSLVLFFPAEAFNPTISYRTHVIGFGLGLVWGLVYFLWHRRRLRSAETYRIIMDEPPSTESEPA